MYIIAKRKNTNIGTRIPVASVLYWVPSDDDSVTVHLVGGGSLMLNTIASKFDTAFSNAARGTVTNVDQLA